MMSLLARIAFFLLLSFSVAPIAQAALVTSSPTTQTANQGQSGLVTAQPTHPGIGLTNPLNVQCNNGGSCLLAFVTAILNIVIEIGSIAIVFMLVWVGFLFVVVRGAPEEVSKARKALLWTVIGALILLGAKSLSLGIAATVQSLSGGS